MYMINMQKLIIGDRIEVNLKSKGKNSKSYYSMVQDILSDDEILITLPTVESIPMIAKPNQEIEISFFRSHGQFCFTGKIIEYCNDNSIELLKIKRITQNVRIQRRNFYRLNVTLPVKVNYIDASGQEYQIDGYSCDIGGGGMGVIMKRHIPLYSDVNCSFSIDTDNIIIKGNIIRIEICKDDEHKYQMGIKFTEVSEYTRDVIVKFIFNQQRKRIRKGLI